MKSKIILTSKPLDDALDRGTPGTTMDKRNVATFTGKFIVKKDRSSHPVFTLEISND
jgi:hypothetical protein